MPKTNGMTIKEAAEILGKSQQFIRVGLQKGILPFGTAVKMSTKYTYYVSPTRLDEFVGKRKAAIQ